MESYRCKISSQADFEKFFGWLFENRYDFTTRQEYGPSSEDHVYHVTVTNKNSDVSILDAIKEFLANEVYYHYTIESTADMYSSAEDAANDPYADPESLRRKLRSSLDHVDELEIMLGQAAEEKEKLQETVKAAQTDTDYYRDAYFKKCDENSRIKEQVKAVALLMDSLFPKEK